MMETIRSYFLFKGSKKAVYSFAAAVVFMLFDLELLASISFVLGVFFLFVYRNLPRIKAEIADYGVSSPVDGKIVSIENINEKEYGYKIVIDSSWLYSGVLRSPFEARSIVFSLQRGSRLSKDASLFATLNEHLEVLFKSETKKVKVIHRLKRSPLRIELFTEKEQLSCGEIYGFAYDSLSVIYLPKEFRLNVYEGERLYASQNIIGYFSN